jgi:uncharacterized membrane protein YjdF
MKNIAKKICEILDNILRILIIILLIYKLINNDLSNIGMPILAFILSFYNIIIRNVLHINLNYYSRILLTILLFLAQLLGSSLGFYNLFDNWDLIVHFISGIVIFYVGYNIVSNLCEKNENKLEKKVKILFSIFFALSIGSVWEMYEYLIDGILNIDSQRTANLIGRIAIKDTMTDLLASTFGTILTAIIFIMIRRKENNVLK